MSFPGTCWKKYLAKIQLLDPELQNKFQSSIIPSNIYVIDVQMDDNKDNEHINTIIDYDTLQTNSPKINLDHMGVVLAEVDESYDNQYNEPKLNIYNIGVICFMSCIDCSENGCPGKGPCCKLATDILRLWNTLQYKPQHLVEEQIKAIKEGILMMYYNQEQTLYTRLPNFIQKEINSWNI